jgi:predicted RNA-binding Zn-ribbon protein involved in translation (DUF1610 family)
VDVQGFILLLLLVLVGLFLFAIYFVFKVLDFFVNATRLYRRMVRRQDATIKLLLDIRDNTKAADLSGLDAPDDDQQEEMSPAEGEADDPHTCFHCGWHLETPADICPHCGKGLSRDSEETADADDGEETPESDDLNTCYHCGEELKAPASMCPSCGKELK